MTETLALGSSSESAQWELSNEYQHDRVTDGLDCFQKYLLYCALDESIASALEGLNMYLALFNPIYQLYLDDSVCGHCKVHNAL